MSNLRLRLVPSSYMEKWIQRPRDLGWGKWEEVRGTAVAEA